MQSAERIAAVKEYFFASLGKRIAELKAEGLDVIRMDIGSPDLPPADFIIEALVERARQPDAHGYSLGGTQEFRQAAALHYDRRFGVKLDPKREVIDLIGSKEGLFILSQVLLDPGDLALVPDPAYSVYAMGARIAGAEVHSMPLLAENGFLPELEAIPEEVAKRAKLLWLNYPNNPTGAVADLDYFKKVIEFGREHDVLVAHDAPYTDLCFDGYVAPSLLNVPGAKDVAVEFNSLSKTYNMAGWRLGMAVGNPEALSYIERYKSQQDSALFKGVMAGGIAALTGDQSWIESRNAILQERRDIVMEAMREADLEAEVPRAAMYVWAKIPAGETSVDFCARMLEETGVSTTPGSVFGQYGEGYLRVSLVTSTDRLREAMERVANWRKVQV